MELIKFVLKHAYRHFDVLVISQPVSLIYDKQIVETKGIFISRRTTDHYS